MAKAKKPSSGSKGPSQSPDTSAADPAAKKPDAETSAGARSSASKAAQASAAKTTSTAKSDAAKAADKPSTAKPEQAAPASADKATSTKPTAESKANAPTADAKKPEDKPNTDAAKADTPKANKPAATKTAGSDAKTSKPDAPKVAEPVKTPPNAETPKTPPPAAAAPPAKSGGVVLSTLLGVVIAAVLGFIASEMNLFNTRANTDGLQASLDAQAERIGALENATPVAPEMPDLSGLETSIASLDETVTAMQAQLEELEARPAIVVSDDDGASAEQAAAYAAELAALQESVEAQKGEIQRLLDNALSVEEATANAAQAAAAQAALAKITTAISDGSPYADAMQSLQDSGIADIPDAIGAAAADGVATLSSLQADLPATARDALSATRAAGNDGGEDGVAGFLRRQLGARSVAPREGSDPDAVLSRVEAAVRDGQLAQALTEIDALPAEAQDAMAGWISSARTRADAQAAVQELSQRLSAN